MNKPLPTLEYEEITSVPALAVEVMPPSGNVLAPKAKKAYLWQPGQSGNPNGRPKASYMIADLAKQHTEEALATLVEIFKDKNASPNARVNAANAILDRAWGKPAQALQATNTNVDVKDWREVLAENFAGIEADMAEARRVEAERWKRDTAC